MKKYGLKLLIFVLIFSCSKEENSKDSPIQAELTGSWSVIGYNLQGNTTIIEIDDIYFTNFTDFFGTAGTINLTMTFNDSGAYNFNGFYYMDNAVYPNEGQAYSFTNYHTIEEEGTWSLDGNKLDVIIEGEERRIGISELTDSRLILRINTGTSQIDDNQTTTTTNTQETYVLERQ